ncbi:MAG: PspC domain-containing protein [Bacteroidetes bacterium]|nr:MAG: PspC domain-containing protein [Bacteroidota bacterium]
MGIIYFRQSSSAPASGEGAAPAEGADAAESSAVPPRPRQFRRSYRDKKLAGVCGGLAEYFGVDPSIMRLLYVVLCLASFGAALVLYVILALAVPYDYTLTTP